jgi:hypothetical protein
MMLGFDTTRAISSRPLKIFSAILSTPNMFRSF